MVEEENGRNFTTVGKVFIRCDRPCMKQEYPDYIYFASPQGVEPAGHTQSAPLCINHGAPDQKGESSHFSPLVDCRVCLIVAQEKGLAFKEVSTGLIAPAKKSA